MQTDGVQVKQLMKMKMKVYVDLMSQPCRAVMMFLIQNRIPHEVQTIQLRRGEQKTAEFTELNPMQKVPVLDDNGFVLTESDAILKYLATTCNVAEHWYPQQPHARARVDEYTAWHHTNTRPHAASVFILEVLLPRMTGSPVDELKLQRSLNALEETLNKLETMFLKNHNFLCGDDITLADLLAICELMQPVAGGRDVLQGRPKLQQWRKRVEAALRQTFHQTHSLLYKLRDKHTSKL